MGKFRFWTITVLAVFPLLTQAAGPDVVLKDLSGKDHNVQEFIGQGKWTLVTVWSADCPICKRDIHHMAFFHDANMRKNAQVLGLSVDGYKNHKKAQEFIDDHALDFPNLIGTREDAERLSKTRFIGTPTYYFFSPEGALVTHRIGTVTQEEAERIIQALEAKRTQRDVIPSEASVRYSLVSHR